MNRTAWILTGVLAVAVGAIVIFVAGGDDPDTTTTTTLASTTTAGPTTTVDGEATTSSADGTSTTSGNTTTTAGEQPTTTGAAPTTTAPVSTTAPAVAGNWAAEPLVAAPFGALGWWDGNAWVQADGGTSLPVVGGEDYQAAFLGVESILTGGPPTTLCEPINNPAVALENEAVLGDWPGPMGVGISAGWVLTPHPVEAIEDDGTLAALAGELLAERGLNVPDPVMKQVLQTDLDGDGVNELIVVSEDVTEGLLADSGDYSLAFLQQTTSAGEQTVILGESVIVIAENPFVYSFSVGAVADLNGDGTMEILLTSAYYEGIGVEVWQVDEQGAFPQIASACGA